MFVNQLRVAATLILVPLGWPVINKRLDERCREPYATHTLFFSSPERLSLYTYFTLINLASFQRAGKSCTSPARRRRACRALPTGWVLQHGSPERARLPRGRFSVVPTRS
eukprot:scaffold32802_cov61-Phaeocystis_antarctica.AAC.3